MVIFVNNPPAVQTERPKIMGYGRLYAATEFILSMKIESLLVSVAGFMAVTTAVTSYKNTHAQKYKLLVIGSEDFDVIGWSCVFLAVMGLANILTGFVKTFNKYKLSFNKHLCIIVATLVGNFCIAMTLTEHKNKILNGLDGSMTEQLKASILSQQRFGVGFQLAEAWDFMQMKMLCCGVHSYKDYAELGGVNKIHLEQILPLSCCALKPPLPDGTIEADNLKQCQLDAKLGVVNSIFLHTQGCHSPITRWLLRHVNKTVAMIFGTICFQALTVFYLSWIGFRRSSALTNRS